MHIIQVNSQFNGGGVDTHTLDLCSGLVEAGHEVTLVINEGARWEARARSVGGLKVESVGGSKLSWILALKRLARRSDVQIVHAHHGRDYWTTGLACRMAGNGSIAVLTRHLMTPLSFLSARYLLSLGHVVAVSKAVQAQLEQELSGDLHRLHLIYAGVDTERFKPDPEVRQRGRRTFGWDESHVIFALIGAAGLPDGKGQIEFVEAGARLIKENPSVRLLIVGEGGLIPILQGRIAQLNMVEQIRCTGFADNVERIAAMIDVLVHPAVGTEALGLVLWEAMASGKPVIASRLGGIPEAFLVPDHGQLIEPRNIDDLYAAMARYASDRALRERNGIAARQYILDKEYTRRGQAQRFAELYRRVAFGKDSRTLGSAP